MTDLRNGLYEHILKQSFAFLGRSTTGSLMSHITTDVEKIQAAVSELAGDLLKEGLSVLGLLIVLFWMDWRLALLSLVGLPAVLYPLLRLGRRLRASNETSLRRWKDISEILQETISGFRVVKAFGMEGFEIARFRRAASRLLNVSMRITRTTAVLPPLMEGLGGLALVAALFYGSWAINQTGRITPGAFVAFLTALFAMYTPIKRLSRVNATLQAALAAGHRVLEVLDRHDELPEVADAVAAAADAERDRVPRGRLPLRGRARHDPAQRELQREDGRGGGDRGHERRGQDDARQPAAALLRRQRRCRC